MNKNGLNRWVRAARSAAGLLALTGFTACYLAEVEGERSADMGACPEGEVCSKRTPTGLRFVGAFLFDNETLRLGPVIAGGTFDLGLRAHTGEELPAYAFEIENPTVLRGQHGQGVFGPLDERTGQPLYPVDGHLTLTGRAAGQSYVRIVDPETGELFDRLPLDVVEIEDVRLVNVGDEEREELLRGQEELLGIRLLAADDGREIRAIDDGLEFYATGNVQPELMYWDCFRYQVPEDMDEVTFEIRTAGQLFRRTWSVRDPRPDELERAAD